MESLIQSLPEAIANGLAGIAAAGGTLMVIGLFILALLLVYFIRIHIAYRMARNRHRDPLGWVLLSVFVSPLMVWIILLIAGDAR